MALGLTPQQIIDKDKNPLLRINENWERVLLEKLANVQNGYAFSSKYFNREQGLPLIRIRDIRRKETENLYSGNYDEDFLVNHNDILIGMDGDFYASKWPGEKGLLNQRVCRLLFHSKHYEKEFFFLCLQPYLDAIHEETSSVTVKHLSSNTIKKIPLPLPPLPEQRAIVAKIEELFSDLDNGIANLQKAQEQLKIYRQAVLKKAFEGELTKKWREKQTNLPTAEELLEQIKEERQKHYEQQLEDWKKAVKAWEEKGKEGKKPVQPNKYKTFNSPIRTLNLSIPNNWIMDCVGNVCSKTEYGSSAKSDDIGEVPVIRMGNLQGGEIDWSDLKYSSDYTEIKQYLLKKGDVLFNRTNSPELVGKTAKYNGEQPAIFAGYLIRLNHIDSIIKGSYLNYFLNSHPAKIYGSYVKTDGVNQSNINGEKLSNYPIPVCSINEQYNIVREIESRLSVCDQVENDITLAIERSRNLRQSILKKAFEGKLLSEAEVEKCKQEPDYEPASVLLARIERSRNEKIKKEKK